MDYGPGSKGPKSPLKLAARRVFQSLESIFPTVYYVLRYELAERQARNAFESKNRSKWRSTFFEDANSAGRKCLQIGVFEGEGRQIRSQLGQRRQVRSTRLHRLSR